MAKHVTMRFPTALHDALADALATGEGVADAAAALMAAGEAHPVTIFEGPAGSKFRVNTGYPVSFLWPQRNPDGDISIPVRLRWYSDDKLTEARGTEDDARELIRRLKEILDRPVEPAPAGPETLPSGE